MNQVENMHRQRETKRRTHKGRGGIDYHGAGIRDTYLRHQRTQKEKHWNWCQNGGLPKYQNRWNTRDNTAKGSHRISHLYRSLHLPKVNDNSEERESNYLHKSPERLLWFHQTCSNPRRAICSHSLVCSKNSLLILGIGPILNKELELIFRSDRSDCTCVYS